MKVSKETCVIATIGLLDLATTIVFIQRGGAEEANPIFHRYWQMGIPVFIFAKLTLLFCPLAVVEWARSRRPRFVSLALRTGIAGYVTMYCVGFMQLNAQAVTAKDSATVMQEASIAPRRGEILARLALWHAKHGTDGTAPYTEHPTMHDPVQMTMTAN